MSGTRTEPHHFSAKGFGTYPCPGCGLAILPQQPLLTVPGVWQTWHAVCFEARCSLCGESHADGSCLL